MVFSYKGATIYYEIHGKGVPIIMIHGGGPDNLLMKGCMEPIFEMRQDYKRIYFDLPGMGCSTTAKWITSTDDILEVVEQFIKTVLPYENFLLAGESYGGYLARGIISKLKSRVQGLLMICPVIKEHKDRILPEKKVLVSNSELLASLTPDDRKFYEDIAVVQDQKTWRHYEQYILPGLKKADYNFLERVMSTGYAFSAEVDSLIGVFDKPTLFLTGRQDANVGYQDALALIENYPRGTFAVLDRAGHCLESEQKNVFECLTKEWLSRCLDSVNKFQQNN